MQTSISTTNENVLDFTTKLNLIFEKTKYEIGQASEQHYSGQNPYEVLIKSVAKILHEYTKEPFEQCEFNAEKLIKNLIDQVNQTKVKDRLCTVLRYVAFPLKFMEPKQLTLLITSYFPEGLLVIPVIGTVSIPVAAISAVVLYLIHYASETICALPEPATI